MLYFAYGSNLNKEQMKYRCPKARQVTSATLDGYRLVFRGVADVIKSPGYEVQGGLWKITKSCLKALDRYEGYPSLYRRKFVPVFVNELPGEYCMAIVYYMVTGTLHQPSNYYLSSILEGYGDFGITPYDDILKPNIGIGQHENG